MIDDVMNINCALYLPEREIHVCHVMLMTSLIIFYCQELLQVYSLIPLVEPKLFDFVIFNILVCKIHRKQVEELLKVHHLSKLHVHRRNTT